MSRKSALDIAWEDVQKLARGITETPVVAYTLPSTLRLLNAEKAIKNRNALIIALLKVVKLQRGVTNTAILAFELRKYNAEQEIEKRRMGGRKRHEPNAKIKREIIDRWRAMPGDKRTKSAKARFVKKWSDPDGFPKNSKTIYAWIKDL